MYVVLDEYEAIVQRMRFVNNIRIFIIMTNIIKYAARIIIADAQMDYSS